MTGLAMLRSVLEEPATCEQDPIWMEPVEGMHWQKVSEGDAWTKADVVANNRLKFELFRRFGVLPGASDTHIAEFFPGFVTQASDFGRDWGVHHYGLRGHQQDKEADDREVVELLAGDEVSPWPSGELVAELIEGVVTGTERNLPMNLPNRGQVENLPDGRGGGVRRGHRSVRGPAPGHRPRRFGAGRVPATDHHVAGAHR